jgi:hypothetical protein
MSRYAKKMIVIEALLQEVPVDELRHDVVLAESLEGKKSFPSLPSGAAFETHTRRARLWLDFIDDLAALSTNDSQPPTSEASK